VDKRMHLKLHSHYWLFQCFLLL